MKKKANGGQVDGPNISTQSDDFLKRYGKNNSWLDLEDQEFYIEEGKSGSSRIAPRFVMLPARALNCISFFGRSM